MNDTNPTTKIAIKIRYPAELGQKTSKHPSVAAENLGINSKRPLVVSHHGGQKLPHHPQKYVDKKTRLKWYKIA